MKNITKKVLTLAMGLMLTVGATAQIKSLSLNGAQNGTTKVPTAAFENLNLQKGGVTASASKAARVTITITDTQSTTATGHFDKNDSTYAYYTLFAYAGVVESYMAQGYSIYTIFRTFYSQGYCSVFNVDTTLTVQGYTPGDTGAFYAFAIESASDTIGALYQAQFICPMGGGNGTAEVTLTIGEVTATTVGISTTMNDQTSYYYLTAFDSTAIVGTSMSDIASMMAQYGATTYSENANGNFSLNTTDTTWAIMTLPFNGSNELGTCAVKYVGGHNGGGVSIHNANGITFNVYPNPATSMINISGEGIHQVELYNALGQRVISEEVNGEAAQLNVNTLSKGAYILKVYGNGAVSVQQVIVK